MGIIRKNSLWIVDSYTLVKDQLDPNIFVVENIVKCIEDVIHKL